MISIIAYNIDKNFTNNIINKRAYLLQKLKMNFYGRKLVSDSRSG